MKERNLIDDHNLEKIAAALAVSEVPAATEEFYERVRKMADRIGAGALSGQTLVLIAALAPSASPAARKAPAPPAAP